MNDLKGIIEDCNKSDLVSDKVIKKIIEIIGQEEWQDLHDENNDICTTMGELIITLKGIADIEKENAELKEELTKKADTNHQLVEQMADLESENAELKDYRLTTLAKQQTGMSKYALNLEHKLSWYDDQLTKAKEIIKTFLGFAEAFGYSPSMDKFITDTEQFLSEVEK